MGSNISSNSLKSLCFSVFPNQFPHVENLCWGPLSYRVCGTCRSFVLGLRNVEPMINKAHVLGSPQNFEHLPNTCLNCFWQHPKFVLVVAHNVRPRPSSTPRPQPCASSAAPTAAAGALTNAHAAAMAVGRAIGKSWQGGADWQAAQAAAGRALGAGGSWFASSNEPPVPRHGGIWEIAGRVSWGHC